jgi:hypothetical protein
MAKAIGRVPKSPAPRTDSKIEGEIHFPERPLDADLTQRADPNQDVVSRISDRIASGSGQARRFRNPQEQAVGIDRKPHSGPSNNSVMSSSVNSKSGEIQILTLSRPGTRRSRFFSTGTRRTSGSPLRAITASSPASARATSRDSEDFFGH